MSWGHPFSRTRPPKIYLVGQLGKYVPGSFWAFLVQMELARKVGVPRSRALAASVVAAGIAVLSGMAVGLLVVPGVADSSGLRYGAAARARRRLRRRTQSAGAHVARERGHAHHAPPTARQAGDVARHARATAWALVSWVAYGVGVWVLAVAAGAPAGESFLLCLGGAALAMTAGFLVFIAPSGIGVREAVLVAALSPVLDTGEALSVALVVRLVFTLADLIGAAATLPVRLSTRAETMTG